MGWRNYWSSWYKTGFGPQSQRSTKRTHKEDRIWSFQDVNLNMWSSELPLYILFGAGQHTNYNIAVIKNKDF